MTTPWSTDSDRRWKESGEQNHYADFEAWEAWMMTLPHVEEALQDVNTLNRVFIYDAMVQACKFTAAPQE